MKWGASSPIQLLDSRHRAKSCPSDSHSRTTSLSNLQRAKNCKHFLATRLYKVVKSELRHLQAPPTVSINRDAEPFPYLAEQQWSANAFCRDPQRTVGVVDEKHLIGELGSR